MRRSIALDLKRSAVNGMKAAEMLVQLLDPDHVFPLSVVRFDPTAWAAAFF